MTLTMNRPTKHLIPLSGGTGCLFWLLMLTLLQGCGIFETRKAEPPSTGGSVFVQPVQPDIVISNLQDAVKTMNTQNYLRCLSDSAFHFTPTVKAQQSNPAIWNQWGKAQEQLYFDNLRASGEKLTGDQLQLNDQDIVQQSGNREQFSANYTLTVVHNRSSQGIPSVATGKLVFILQADGFGLWHIISWTDINATGSFSWSDLKAAFSQG